MLAPRSLQHVFSCVHQPRRGSFESHICTYHSSWSCDRASAAIFDRSVFSPASLAVVYVFLIFALRLRPFPPFSVFPYIRMYVRALLGPVGACVRLCLRVLLPADVPSATRVQHSNFSSVNEIRHQSYCVVVCCWVRTYGTWCFVFGDTLF